MGDSDGGLNEKVPGVNFEVEKKWWGYQEKKRGADRDAEERETLGLEKEIENEQVGARYEHMMANEAKLEHDRQE